MFNLNQIFSRAILAFALAAGAGAATATPVTYHVGIDATSVLGDALLTMSFSGPGNSPSALATITNFTGNIGGVFESGGGVNGSLGTTLTLTNSTVDNFLSQFAVLGGLFGFDITFDVANVDLGVQFGVSLYQPDYDGYALSNGDLVTIGLTPDGSPVLNSVAGLATVAAATAVPEPGELALMLTGLLLMGAVVRRRRM